MLSGTGNGADWVVLMEREGTVKPWAWFRLRAQSPGTKAGDQVPKQSSDRKTGTQGLGGEPGLGGEGCCRGISLGGRQHRKQVGELCSEVGLGQGCPPESPSIPL